VSERKRNPALRDCRCPACGVTLDGATHAMGDDARPNVGDVSICAECGAVSVFVGSSRKLALRPATPDDKDEVIGAIRALRRRFAH
jgi:hypothetical protein